jgi:hypothetical protein
MAALLEPKYTRTARLNLRGALFTLNQNSVGIWPLADPDAITLEPDKDDSGHRLTSGKPLRLRGCHPINRLLEPDSSGAACVARPVHGRAALAVDDPIRANLRPDLLFNCSFLSRLTR